MTIEINAGACRVVDSTISKNIFFAVIYAWTTDMTAGEEKKKKK